MEECEWTKDRFVCRDLMFDEQKFRFRIRVAEKKTRRFESKWKIACAISSSYGRRTSKFRNSTSHPTHEKTREKKSLKWIIMEWCESSTVSHTTYFHTHTHTNTLRLYAMNRREIRTEQKKLSEKVIWVQSHAMNFSWPVKPMNINWLLLLLWWSDDDWNHNQQQKSAREKR